METPTTDIVTKKPKRLTSVVWNHFERVRKADVCYAVCVHCNKKLSGSSNSGTTHLRNHLMRCLKRSNHDISQLLAAKRRRKETNTLTIANIEYDEDHRKLENITSSGFKFDHETKMVDPVNIATIKFDQEKSKRDLARMIMLHGYPLSIVDDIGFKLFVKNLQPLFDIRPNGDIELSCLEIYEKEKINVYQALAGLHGRVNIAVDKWTSSNSSWYVCLTAHYVDKDWKLRKKILNFVATDSSHPEDALSEVVYKCLLDWDIDHKVFSVTYDSCFTNDDVIPMIRGRISQNRPLSNNGKLFDLPCAAHALKSIAQDAIESIRDVAQKIRESVRYVKSSQEMLVKFREIARQAGVDCQKNLILDCQLKWNSTYLMLEVAIEYKEAFGLLREHDFSYAIDISDKEWAWVSSITGYLKLFVEIINGFSGKKWLTANMYFSEMCDVHIQLIDWCKSADAFMSSMALKMKDKFDRYWGKCNLALATAAILDPRFKMKLVEYYYNQIYGGGAMDQIKYVSNAIRELFDAYMDSMSLALVEQSSDWTDGVFPSNTIESRDRLKGFDKFIHETSHTQSLMSDLDRYLEESVVPRNGDVDILNWWKVNAPCYPILSMLARDILGIPISTVELESVFSNVGGRFLDQYRSLLNSETCQALVCTQDWLSDELEESKLSILNHHGVSRFLETNAGVMPVGG